LGLERLIGKYIDGILKQCDIDMRSAEMLTVINLTEIALNEVDGVKRL